tara:strand:+ start:818 stop:1420 length:603 start_codon:yes stop_codon:yes gene_type:complete
MFDLFKKKKIIDYKVEGIEGWRFIAHLDFFEEEKGPLYRDTYQHIDGRITYVYDDQFSDDETLEKLISKQNLLKQYEDKRKKQVSNFSKFIFYPHWVLILFFFLFSFFDYGIYILITLMGYLIAFISSFGLGVRLNFSYIKDFDFEELKILFILMISFLIGSILVQKSELNNLEILTFRIPFIFVPLIFGVLRGRLSFYE